MPVRCRNAGAGCEAALLPAQVYREDVKLQMDAKMLGDEFNLLNPPKKVDFITASLYQVVTGPLQVRRRGCRRLCNPKLAVLCGRRREGGL